MTLAAEYGELYGSKLLNMMLTLYEYSVSPYSVFLTRVVHKSNTSSGNICEADSRAILAYSQYTGD